MKAILRFFTICIFMLIFWPLFLCKKYGNKKYKLEGNTIIICNHYSTYDAFFLYLKLKGKKIYFVTITEVKKKLLSRYLTWLFDCLYIDYDKINVSFIKEALKILKNDGVIGIFPEGEINPRKYGFSVFQRSFIYLARKSKANILPLYLYPELDFFKKSKLYVGDVIRYEEYSQYEDDDYASMYIQSKIMDYSTMV